MMLVNPGCFLNGALIVGSVSMVGFIAVLLVSYAIITPPEGIENAAEYLVDPAVQTIVLLASIASICLLFYIVYKSCRLRKDFGNASQVFSLTSEALRDCNVAIVHANCCIPSKQVPENNGTGTTASDVDLEEQRQLAGTMEKRTMEKRTMRKTKL